MRSHISKDLVRTFTLIELLIVTVVLAILFSVLLPALIAAKDSARNAACISNLRQLGLGLTIYADDNESFAPPADERAFVTYYGSLDGYIHEGPSGSELFKNRLVVCPGSQERRSFYTEWHPRSNMWNSLSTDYYITFRTARQPSKLYGWNYYTEGIAVLLNGASGMDALRNSRYVDSKQTAYNQNDPGGSTRSFTYRGADEQIVIGDVMYCTGYLQGLLGRTDVPMNHNRRGGNVVFLDGHIRHTPLSHFLSAYQEGRWWRDFYVNRDCGGMGWDE